jgi:hypothetical protein
MGYEPSLESRSQTTKKTIMKNETENSAFKQLQDTFWRSQVQSCTTPEQALKLLQDDAGLSPAKAIMTMRRYSSHLFIAWRTKKPPEPKYGGNVHSHFAFRDVHA